jgi:hypothetical protein
MTALATIFDVESVIAQDIPGDSHAQVERLIEMVSGAVCRRIPAVSFTATLNESTVVQPHDGVLRTPRWPVNAVDSVTVGTTLIDPADYTFTERGLIRRVSPNALAPDSQFGGWMSWPIDGEWPWPPVPTTIVYDYGFAANPDDLSLLVAEVVAAKHLGGANRAAGVVSEAIDTYQVSYYSTAPVGAWLPEHAQIIDFYRRSSLTSLRLG